jgi:hypothetical protein
LTAHYPLKTRRYSRASLWQLFLVTAFPIHVWSIILVLKDFSWISERTHVWDAVGVGAYALVLAFLESIFVFFVLLLLGFFLPKQWPEKNRIVVLGVSIWLASLWAIFGQIYFIAGAVTPLWIVLPLSKTDHPLRFLYLGIFILAFPSIFLPVIASLRSEKIRDWILNLFERITLLSALYLFLDLVGLAIVVVRNIG